MIRKCRSLMLAFLVVLMLATLVQGKTPIRMVTYGTGDALARYELIADEFAKAHPEYEVQVEIYPFAEYPQVVTVMVAADSAPDVMMTWAQYKPLWVEQNMVADLTSHWESSDIARNAELFPFMMDAAIYNGRIYGVPHDYSAMSYVLDADALASAGLPAPDQNWTVDDFQAYALRLTRPEQGVYGVSRAGHWSTNSWQWLSMFNGQGWLSDDRTEVLVDQPEHIEMLQWWQDLIARGGTPAPGVTPARGDIWSGGYAMWLGWVHYAAQLESSPYDWTMATMPKGPAGKNSFAQGHMWSIPINAPNPDVSWIFLEWMLSPEGQRSWVQHHNRQPLSPDPELWDLFFSNVSFEKRPLMQRLVMDVMYGQNLIHNMEYFTAWADVDRIMNRHLNTVFAGQVAPGPAMSQAAAEIRIVMDQ